MWQKVVIWFFIAILQIGNLANASDSLVIKKFRDHVKDSGLLVINENNINDEINFADEIYYLAIKDTQVIRIDSTGIRDSLVIQIPSDVKKFKNDNLRKIRKKYGHTLWYIKIKNDIDEPNNFYVKVGNNKVSEIQFDIYLENKLTKKCTIGLGDYTNDTIRFGLSKLIKSDTTVNLSNFSFPVFIPEYNTIEILINMPKRHSMLDMNTSVNLNNENLPLTINSTTKELRMNKIDFFFYGIFISFFAYYLFALFFLLKILGDPVLGFNKGDNLRKNILWFILMGGLTLIAHTGLTFKLPWWVIDFLSKYFSFFSSFFREIQIHILPYLEIVFGNIFSSLFTLSGIELLKRGVPVSENVKWYKFFRSATLLWTAFSIACSLLLIFDKTVEGYWLFYDVNIIIFIALNALLLLALLSYLIKTKDISTFKNEKNWLWSIFGIYLIILAIITYTALTCTFQFSILRFFSPNWNNQPNIYALVYSVLIIITSFLSWVLFHRISLLNKKILYNRQHFISKEKAIENERERSRTFIHDEIGPMFTDINLALYSIENNNENPKNTIELKRIRKTCEKIMNETYRIIEDIPNPASVGLKQNLLNYIENLPVYVERYINIKETTYQNVDLTNDIYRIIIELINNTIKHANASLIELKLQEIDDYLFIVLQDDGIGFDMRWAKLKKEKSARPYTGLSSIIKRVEREYGKIKINSKIDKGTTIEIKYPLKKLKENPLEKLNNSFF